MRIKLRKIALKDFKGIVSEEFEFLQNESFIHGDNGTGKTTLYDAFLWCLFGKDHEDRSDYRIKPIKPDGSLKSKPECEVSLILDVDGMPLRLSRIYKEKWTKPKTEPEPVYDGDTTVFYVNDIAVSMSEYNLKIKELFSDMSLFKSLTNVRYFTSFKKDEQRKLLFSMVEEISDEEVASSNPDFLQLLKDTAGVSFAAYKKDLAAKKKKISDEVNGLPDRIKGLEIGRPEQLNWTEIEDEVSALTEVLREIDVQIMDVSKTSEAAGKAKIQLQEKINSLKSEMSAIESSEKNDREIKVAAIKQKIKLIDAEIKELENQKSNAEEIAKSKAKRKATVESLITQKETLLVSLRAEWTKINSSKIEFKEGEFECPTCKRPLEVHDIDEKQKTLTEHFNNEKKEKLEANKQKGLRVKQELEELKQELVGISTDESSQMFSGTKIAAKKEQISAHESEIKKINDEPFKYKLDKAYLNAAREIFELEEKIKSFEVVDNDKLVQSKKAITEKVDGLKSQLYLKSVIENTNKLIAEHEASFKTLNQALSELERSEFILKQFEFAKIDAYEDRVNSLFKVVKFKLFDRQKDGQIVADCEATINGVPFGTLNNAKQVAAGLDIIDAISRSKDMYVPIFIDNREGVVSLPPVETQVINLVVEKGAQLHVK